MCGRGGERSLFEVTGENPHGHSDRVLVRLAGEALESNGVMLDFEELKNMLRPIIDLTTGGSMTGTVHGDQPL